MASPDATPDRVSVWHDQTGDLVNIGGGEIDVDDDDGVAIVDVNGNLAKKRGLPDDLTGPHGDHYKILATVDGDVVYEGKVLDHEYKYDMAGNRCLLTCDPPEIVDP